MSEIRYKLNGTFYLKLKNGKDIVGFDVQFPHVYKTKDALIKTSENISMSLIRNKDGIVVLTLYEYGQIVKRIKWDEWWSYKCYKIKRESAGKDKITSEDFVPYCETFEEIFKLFTKRKKKRICPLEYQKYHIESVAHVKNLEPSSIEEEFLGMTDDEMELRCIGTYYDKVIPIKELSTILDFNEQDFYIGNRFLFLKFEKEFLSSKNNLRLRDYSHFKFLRFCDGKYYKKIVSETGFNMGYQLKYIKFDFFSEEKQLQLG